jgi:Alg9-like mannosyltransferase family
MRFATFAVGFSLHMIDNIRKTLAGYYREHPLRSILLTAFAVRLLAAFFAPGYMMHDDHFLTIEPSASWADGKNFNHWLPGIGNTNAHPEPISFFYLGFLYLIFKILHFLGIEHPEMQMLCMRIVHAAYSLLTIFFAYRITELLSNRKNATLVGWLLACIAILPNFSVRNLVEIVCMPPLLGGMWLLLKNVPLKAFSLGPVKLPSPTTTQPTVFHTSGFIGAAFLMGLAVGFRYQTGLFVAMVGCVLALQHSIRSFLAFGAISFAAFFITQIDDVLLWGGQPFQHVQGYFEYNKKNALNYPGSPWAYLSFIGVFILPPVSLFLTTGFFASIRKLVIIVLPALGFLLFHLVYPNKQERFILPMLPFFVIAGVIGWNQISTRITEARWHRISWKAFWIINTLGMLVLCFTYSKKSRVEAMTYLYEAGDCNNFILEFTHSDHGAMMPQFYSNCWTTYYYFKKGDPVEGILRNADFEAAQTANDLMPRALPNYILFYDDEQLEERIATMQRFYPSLTYRTTIESGWFDQLLHTLNPKNSLEKIHIYGTGQPVPPVFDAP